MAARVFQSLAQIEVAIGETLGPSDWIMLDQERVNRFAEVTGDRQWIHIDPERAACSNFGGTIVHGYLTLSLLPTFGHELYSIDIGSARLNYGLERVRFPAAVRVGSRVRASVSVASLNPSPAGNRIAWLWTVECEGVDRPVCVAESIIQLVN